MERRTRRDRAQYTTFGATGLTVPRLCLGTATFGHQADETVAQKIMDTAVEAGVTFFDSADIYPMGGEGGRAEEIVGRWLQGKRDQIILATKAGGPMGPARRQRGGSRKHLLDAIDGSLHRLGTDYVDIYQLHFDDPDTPLDETLATLDAIVTAGKARYIGVSNFLAYRLARGRRAHRDVAPHPYRVGSTALQPAVPADRTRAAAPGRRSRHGGDSVQPAGRGSTQRQIPA